MFSYIDLFAGAGGWSCGLGSAGWQNQGFYEINASECRTAEQNFDFPVSEIDLNGWKKIHFPRVAVIIGSPPCQGFSNEGYKNKFDLRNNLVWTYLDIVNEIRPEVWVFENVPGFQRLYRGQYYREFCKRVERMGYVLNANILDMSNYGVPQIRKRFIAIGHRKHCISFPNESHTKDPSLFARSRKVTLWEAISDLPEIDHGERKGEFAYDKPAENSYQAWAREGSRLVFNHTTQRHGERILAKIRAVPIGGDMSYIVGAYEENRTHYCGGYRRAIKDSPSYTAYWTRGMTSIHPEKHRFLSPRECARLQCFKDSFVFHGTTIENYTQICNAVPPLFAQTMGTHLNAVLGGANIAA